MSNRLSFNSREEKHQFWEGHVQRWQQSSLTQNAYCKKYNLQRSSFSSWKQRLNKFTQPVQRKVTEPSFIEVTHKAIVKQKPLFAVEISSDGTFRLSLNLDSSLFS